MEWFVRYKDEGFELKNQDGVLLRQNGRISGRVPGK